jgi:lyso-ornithine lipid O-acyltransferase
VSPTWRSDDPPPPTRPPGAAGWARAVLRGAALGLVTFGGLAVLLLVRLVEAPLHGLHRPWTPWITQGVCRTAFVILGIRHRVTGAQMRTPGAVVANHSSWLDIFALNARKRVYFVSKAEVAGWPGIGWLARATGTVFITRDPGAGEGASRAVRGAAAGGPQAPVLPEGTSTDGRRVLPFKSTLFGAFFAHGLRDLLHVQPVSVIWTAPPGEDARFYGWWGDMDFGAHLLRVLAAPRGGAVEIAYHPPIRVAEMADRKALAAAARRPCGRGSSGRKQHQSPLVPADARPGVDVEHGAARQVAHRHAHRRSCRRAGCRNRSCRRNRRPRPPSPRSRARGPVLAPRTGPSASRAGRPRCRAALGATGRPVR